ncbi:MAG: exosome complex exonuclease Rrp41, partial [Candidatus Nanoarchaeia archaeon]
KVIREALMPVVFLEEFPKAGISIFMHIVQADAGTRTAAINAASVALADAGIPMKDLVSAVSMGKVEDTMVLDLDYIEDSHEIGVDIPVAMIHHSKEISLLQMDGIITKEELMKNIDMVKKACDEIYEVQKQALKDSFAKGE